MAPAWRGACPAFLKMRRFPSIDCPRRTAALRAHRGGELSRFLDKGGDGDARFPALRQALRLDLRREHSVSQPEPAYPAAMRHGQRRFVSARKPLLQALRCAIGPNLATKLDQNHTDKPNRLAEPHKYNNSPAGRSTTLQILLPDYFSVQPLPAALPDGAGRAICPRMVSVT